MYLYIISLRLNICKRTRCPWPGVIGWSSATNVREPPIKKPLTINYVMQHRNQTESHCDTDHFSTIGIKDHRQRRQIWHRSNHQVSGDFHCRKMQWIYKEFITCNINRCINKLLSYVVVFEMLMDQGPLNIKNMTMVIRDYLHFIYISSLY